MDTVHETDNLKSLISQSF